jgi:modulator of FtsH protease HflK
MSSQWPPSNGSNDELQELINQAKQFLNRFKLGGAKWAPIAGVVLVVVAALTMFYTVQPSEEAVVLRLGKYHATNPPGLHFKLPFGFDKVIKVKTKLVHQDEFGFRSSGDRGQRTRYSSKYYKNESLMLTGDLNVADVEWIVQYQISDPRKLLFNVRDVNENIRDVSQSIMRRVVGDRTVNSVLTVGRVEVAEEAKKLIQEVLDYYDMGVRIVTVKLQDVNPPEPVKPSFNEVNEAKQEQEKVINNAEKFYNNVIPEARGKAQQKIADAEGYAAELLNHAKGDAENFLAKLNAYKRAPKITRTRLYLETIEELYQRLSEMTLVDSGVKGILPVFDHQRNAPKSGGEKSE